MLPQRYQAEPPLRLLELGGHQARGRSYCQPESHGKGERGVWADFAKCCSIVSLLSCCHVVLCVDTCRGNSAAGMLIFSCRSQISVAGVGRNHYPVESAHSAVSAVVLCVCVMTPLVNCLHSLCMYVCVGGAPITSVY